MRTTPVRTWPWAILEFGLRVSIIPLNITPRHNLPTTVSVISHEEFTRPFKELYLLYFERNFSLGWLKDMIWIIFRQKILFARVNGRSCDHRDPWLEWPLFEHLLLGIKHQKVSECSPWVFQEIYSLFFFYLSMCAAQRIQLKTGILYWIVINLR